MNEAVLQNARRAQELGNLPEAARLYAQILRTDSKHFPALYSLGVVHYDRGGFEDARRVLAEAVKLQPQSPEAHFALACALQKLSRHGQALDAFDSALALRPDYPDAQLRRANSLLASNQFRDAVESYERYLAVHPSSGEAWHNRGVALSQLKKFGEAIGSFGKALALRPESAESWINRANAHFELNQLEEAINDSQQALAINPALPNARGYHALYKLHCCDWRGIKDELAAIASGLRAGQPTIVPFGNVMVSHSPADQMSCARLWMERHAGRPAPLWRGERYEHPRTRVAYLSGDFRQHPVAILMAGVFEHHDRAQFETIGISLGAGDQSEIRARVSAGVERFIDARAMSDFKIASLLREMEVDIAVDLMGLTADCRSGIFAFRSAPVQVNYLGYPGTMAADFMDYIIADATVIPEGHKRYYYEKVVHLPDTYLATDNARRIAPRKPSRAEADLPEKGFVFCSFNNSYKFTPDTFTMWMRLLRNVEGSVLWLPEGHAAARRNLKREAQDQGVAPERIVFAPLLPSPEDHLARLSLADLFLDTLPCNAHSTAADALWAGLPVLTCQGSTFAGLVAASLLKAADLPELITDSRAEYEALALSLARDPDSIPALKANLARNRQIAPLFDTARFTRHLEAAFLAMRERTARGLAPQSFAIASVVQ